MSRLISMTDFVFEQSEKRHEKTNDYGSTPISTGTDFDRCLNYANFLKQKLELCMFVPCKLVYGVWFVFEEPFLELHFTNKQGYYNYDGFEQAKKEYQEAKERCLFEGFEIEVKANGNRYVCRKDIIYFASTENDKGLFRLYSKYKTIENLVKYNLELTKTAQKQIGL